MRGKLEVLPTFSDGGRVARLFRTATVWPVRASASVEAHGCDLIVLRLAKNAVQACEEKWPKDENVQSATVFLQNRV